MPKTLIGIIIFAIVVVLAWAGATYFLTEEVVPPAVSQETLQPLDPNINRTYLDDLQARADNRIGIELEL